MAANPIRRPLRESARELAKQAYLAIPFKKAVFETVRPFWTPPAFLLPKLYFRGTFDLAVPNGQTLTLQHTCSPVETGMFWKGLLSEWEKTSLGAWIDLSRRSRAIVDVGANSGIYALTARAVNPDASIVAFEPMPRIHEKLVANVALNGARIECVRAAASNYDGVATMYDLPNAPHTYGGTVNKDLYAPIGLQAIPLETTATRLDTFLSTHSWTELDLIKIDVESHEPEVIEGLGALLVRFRPSLIVEVWNDEVGKAIEDRVAACGYRYYATDERGPFERRPAIVQRGSGPPFTNFLLCRDELADAIGLP
jgi:FkbM family methyltransferase